MLDNYNNQNLSNFLIKNFCCVNADMRTTFHDNLSSLVLKIQPGVVSFIHKGHFQS